MTSNGWREAVRARPYRESGILPIDIVNTWDPLRPLPERLPDPPALRAFLGEYGIRGRPLDEDLARFRLLRRRIREVVAAPTAPELVKRLDAFAAELRAVPAIEQSAPGRWELTVRPFPEARLVDRLAVLAVAGLGRVVGRYGPERIGECNAAPCRDAFVDMSKNGGRRYCSKRCANRRNAAEFRRRSR